VTNKTPSNDLFLTKDECKAT